jgi:hypothetical protein
MWFAHATIALIGLETEAIAFIKIGLGTGGEAFSPGEHHHLFRIWNP